MPTINDMINRVNTEKPNDISTETMVQWLSEIEGQIWSEYIEWHDCSPQVQPWPYDPIKDLDTELMIQPPYSDVYTKYLMAMIDARMGDVAHYQNDMLIFNVALSTYIDWYNRKHKPSTDVCIYV